MADATIVYQMEFAGVGAGWTTITTDVHAASGVRFHYGIDGSGPNDRVASTGTMQFALKNGPTNSAATTGYYSPNHASVRAGFALGIRVRVKMSFAGTDYYKFLGVLETIEPVAGKHRERIVLCTAVDWMDEAAKFVVQGIATQVAKRSDEDFATILAAIPKQPQSSSIATGNETYAFSLDNARGSAALSAFQQIASSERGYVYVKGDTTAGGKLVFLSRHGRVASSVNVATFTESMVGMTAYRSRSEVLNRLQVTVHPRRADTSLVTLWTLQSVPTIEPGETQIYRAEYVDPAQKAARVGGYAMVAPVATTDYTMNAAADGSGTDLTTALSVTALLGGDEARLTLTHTGNGMPVDVTGHITSLKVRGKGLYTYEAVSAEVTDATSITTYGENLGAIDMPYQDDVTFASEVANFELRIYKDPLSNVSKATFFGNTDATMMTQCLAREISDRIGIVETVTGISTASNRGYYINAVDMAIEAGGIVICTWSLAPADSNTYWILDQVGASELDISTRLGL